MSKYILPAAALFALTFAVGTADKAEAQGFHFNTGRVHVNVGNPHGYYGGYGGYGYGGYHQRVQYQPRYWGGSHLVWHDTSHYDYHPTEYRRHGNHVDVVPGHYDFHREGHYDVHRGGHGGHH